MAQTSSEMDVFGLVIAIFHGFKFSANRFVHVRMLSKKLQKKLIRKVKIASLLASMSAYCVILATSIKVRHSIVSHALLAQLLGETPPSSSVLT